MTSLADTISILHAHLDASPTDWLLRRVLADAYEEAGDINGAAFQRWCAEERRAPRLWPDKTWNWWKKVVTYKNSDDGSELTASLFGLLGVQDNPECTFREYPTRRAAEADLFGAWCQWITEQR